MFIEHFSYTDTVPTSKWNFNKVNFKRTNLLVGKSGCGKTRFISTIFNLAFMIASVQRDQDAFKNGHWKIGYRHKNRSFRYEIKMIDMIVEYEKLQLITDESKQDLIVRTNKSLTVNSVEIPQLALEQPAISLLKEGKIIKIAHNAFSFICRRSFDTSVLDLVKKHGQIPNSLIKKYEKTGQVPNDIYDMPLSSRLFLIEKINKKLYLQIINMFMDVFPEITSIQIRKLTLEELPSENDGVTPGVFLTEKNVEGQILLTGLSSGMQKVLLIIADVLSAPKGTTYLIDEYENSLGVNAIDFLPDLLTLSTDIQTLITTHHPYLINAMPIENWQIMSRNGSEVSSVRGDSRKKIYSASAQEAFTQLMNDPLYANS
ncbi:MAG: ATP-binding protein [Maribacter sp.]|nr:ATP-binding protein [Maribacter sp.]